MKLVCSGCGRHERLMTPWGSRFPVCRFCLGDLVVAALHFGGVPPHNIAESVDSDCYFGLAGWIRARYGKEFEESLSEEQTKWLTTRRGYVT